MIACIYLMLYFEAFKVDRGFIQELKPINKRLTEEKKIMKETNSPI
jgi:hypothetical protein